MIKLKCAPTRNYSLALTNFAYVGGQLMKEWKCNNVIHLKIRPLSTTREFIISAKVDQDNSDEIQLSGVQRSWLNNVAPGDLLSVQPLNECPKKIKTVLFSISATDEKSKASVTSQQLNLYMSKLLSSQHLSLGQIVPFLVDKKVYKLTVVLLKCVEKDQSANMGVCTEKTGYQMQAAQGSNVIVQSDASKMEQTEYFSPFSADMDFSHIGVGGLNREFQTIFRRAFITRLFDPQVMHDMGIKHCRGILLHGPPGTGKTLLARQIGKMLNAREPKIVNGPQILDKYVGASEENVRNLFVEAEQDEKKFGIKSPLNMIIFDEIDAICKQRGSRSGSSAVTDTVINQLLSKLDGVEQLNNILVIGMTNRLDMIDVALLRPGRFELHVEIGLPDEEGRQEILKIHTEKLALSNKLNKNVNLAQLAKETPNFSGAECLELVKAATSRALNKHVVTDKSGGIKMDKDVGSKLCVQHKDFLDAIESDVIPAFGSNNEQLVGLEENRLICWNSFVTSVIHDCKNLTNVDNYQNVKTPLITLLFEGAPASGKTSLTSHLVSISNFPFIKFISSKQMIGYSDAMKCAFIEEIFQDAYKSPKSCILIDDIESIIDYAPIGPRFSNMVLQTLLILLNHYPPENHQLLILCTTSEYDLLTKLGMSEIFLYTVSMPLVTSKNDILSVIEAKSAFTNSDRDEILNLLDAIPSITIGIKKLILAIDSSQSSLVKLVDYIMKMSIF